MSISNQFDKDYDRIWTIVDEIISDLKGRGGFDSMWDEIDTYTQDEIRKKWMEIVRERLKTKDSP